jgi:hypoxanthine phosphoribosyltransferase
VLLVDDLADTGETMKFALEKFKHKNVDYVKTATVFKKSGWFKHPCRCCLKI